MANRSSNMFASLAGTNEAGSRMF